MSFKIINKKSFEKKIQQKQIVRKKGRNEQAKVSKSSFLQNKSIHQSKASTKKILKFFVNCFPSAIVSKNLILPGLSLILAESKDEQPVPPFPKPSPVEGVEINRGAVDFSRLRWLFPGTIPANDPGVKSKFCP